MSRLSFAPLPPSSGGEATQQSDVEIIQNQSYHISKTIRVPRVPDRNTSLRSKTTFLPVVF